MTMKSKRILLAMLNLAGFLGTLVVNVLATNLPLNNQSTRALADKYPNLFVPAPFTFSIWGVIYLLLGLFVVYQLVRAFRKEPAPPIFLDRLGILFFISSLANLVWIFLWHYEIVLGSLVVMLVLLATLIAIYLALDIGRSRAPGRERYLVHLPFSVYLGWITVATIANATAVLVYFKWDRWGMSEPAWTVVVMAVGIVLGLWMLISRKDIFYGLVIVWAFLGILIKRMAGAPPVQSVVVTAIAGMAVIALAIVVQFARRKVY